MKSILTISMALFLPLFSFAEELADTIRTDFPVEYLDTVDIRKKDVTNNYFMVGFNYGVSLNEMNYNPTKHGRTFRFSPQYVSLTFTHYEKMFDYLPYFGFQIGVAYGHEGFTWKPDNKGNVTDIDGATDCDITVIELPALAQIHVDVSKVKFMGNIGIYGGYRVGIQRSGPEMDPKYVNSFHDYENRFDYGLQGGLGFAIMLDPVEFHLNGLIRFSWSSLYKPDSYQDPELQKYYFRYAYPFDIIISAGVHFQLTKRTGWTNRALKREAKKLVYSDNDENN